MNGVSFGKIQLYCIKFFSIIYNYDIQLFCQSSNVVVLFIILFSWCALSLCSNKFVTKDDEDLARAVRACEESPNSDGYH